MEALSPPAHRRVTVRQEEDAGALRRAVASVAAGRAGLRPGQAELAATELATNIVRHTTGGYVLYRPAGDGIELLAIDRGPGLRRLGGAWRSWGSTSDEPRPEGRRRGLGAGLATVERLSSAFDLFSARGVGTVVLARLGAGEPTRCGGFRWGAVNVSLDGGGDSGDGWAVAVRGSLTAMAVDGLGHGAGAAEAARAGLAAFGRGPASDPADLLRRAHEAMLGTRGGVASALAIDPGADLLTYAGVGNVSGRILLDGESRGLVAREGTMGTQATPPRFRATTYRWGPSATLVLASDGLRSGWDPRTHRGLLDHDPTVVAATLLRDFARGTDDALALVVQDTRGLPG